MALGVKMRGLSSDIVPVSLQEGQLRVVEDVEVCAAQAVACCPNEEVTVVFASLPPDREVEGGAAQLEAGREQRVTENLREDRRSTRRRDVKMFHGRENQQNLAVQVQKLLSA